MVANAYTEENSRFTGSTSKRVRVQLNVEFKMTEKWGHKQHWTPRQKSPPGRGSDASAMDTMITVTTVHLLSLVFYSIQRNNERQRWNCQQCQTLKMALVFLISKSLKFGNLILIAKNEMTCDFKFLRMA